RVTEYIVLTFWCGLVVTIVGSLLPAKGAVAYLATADIKNALPAYSGTYHLVPLHLLRNAEVFVIGTHKLEGLITFPSFHTVWAMLVAYMWRGTGPIFPLMIFYAALVIASTPLVGGHYFIDIAAGAIIAVLAIGIS